MLHLSIIKKKLLSVVITVLIIIAGSVFFADLPLKNTVNASPTNVPSWFYPEWQYRKANDLTNMQTGLNFYSCSDPWPTISGNPNQRHTFQPVHSDTIIEVDKVVDGSVWKYLAYESDVQGTMIRLYYANDPAGPWTPYSLNPILGPKANYYRWPSTTYVNGVFSMILEDRTGGAIERWTSTDGIHYSLLESVRTTGAEYKNPFIWFNPNDNKWYLYYHDATLVGVNENIKVRSAATLDGLRTAIDTIIVTRNALFGSPSMMYFNGTYWLLAEVMQGSQWQVVAYYSTTSPISGFVEAVNSPIFASDEACPMLFLSPNRAQAYLYTATNSAIWSASTRQVNLNSPTTPQSSDLSNYQIRITVNFGSGASSSDTVYLNNHSQPDFSDVRFTYFDPPVNTEVECPFWIEQMTTRSNAIFWVKVPLIPAQGMSTLYVYYGKNNVTTISNGNATFEFFDDFSSDLSKWTVVSGSWQVQNGELIAQTSGFGQYIRANDFVFGDNSVHVKVKWISGTYFESGPLVRGQAPNEQNNGYITLLSTFQSDSREKVFLRSNGALSKLVGQGNTSPSQNIWYSFVFKMYGSLIKSSVSPLYPADVASMNKAFGSGTLCLFSWSSAAEKIHYSSLFVTKYVYPEPIQAAWYDEQAFQDWAATVTPTPSISTPQPTPYYSTVSSTANPLLLHTPTPSANPSKSLNNSSQPKPTNATSPISPQTSSPTINSSVADITVKSTATPLNTVSIAIVIVMVTISAATMLKWIQHFRKNKTSIKAD